MEDIKKCMDESIRPGDDFFAYATGHWLDYHKQNPEYPSWGTFSYIDNLNMKRLEKIVSKGDDSEIGKKIKALYGIAMDWKRRDAEGVKPLKALIEKEIDPIQIRVEAIKYCTQHHGLPFVDLFICGDSKNPTMNALHMCQGGMSLGNRDYYLVDNDENRKIKQAYRAYIISLYMMVHSTGDKEKDKDVKKKAIRFFNTIWSIEKQIAETAYSVEETQEPDLTYTLMNVKVLCRQSGFDLDAFLKSLGYDNSPEVIVCQPEAVALGLKLMMTLDIDSLKAYLEFQLIDWASRLLDSKTSEIAFKFSKMFNGAKKDVSKKRRAVGMVSSYFSDAIGSIYAKKYFSEKAKKDVEKMVANIIGSYREIIAEKEWISDETKEQAFKKLDTLRIKIGYPSECKDYSDCPIDESFSYLENRIRMNDYFFERNRADYYNQPVNPDEWLMGAHMCNAYYNQTTNEICFPAAILQDHFYKYGRSQAINYGAIGAVIGHEITHGFDNHGRHYNADGKMEDWWKKEETEEFDKRCQNTIDRFNSLEVLPGLKCNGTLTLSENIADNGGVRIAYKACGKAMSEIASRDKVGWEKAFFIAYAQTWAGIMTDEAIRFRTLNNEHSVHYMRVNGTLPMVDEWYDAFIITTDDKLYVEPDKRGKVW